MNIVFVSNYFNHHQKPLCDSLFRLTKGSFVFVATSRMSLERALLGYAEEGAVYVKRSYESAESERECAELIASADAVIFGSAPECFLTERKLRGKLIFRYFERPFKRKSDMLRKIPFVPLWISRNPKKAPIYLLSAGAFAASDYRKIGLFRGKAYKWGYFPKMYEYDTEKLISGKDPHKIVWCGRLIPQKKASDAVKLAKMLNDNGYDFSLDIIGNGEELYRIKESIKRESLEKRVHMSGAVPYEMVRGYMERAAIFIFTADRREGWGAVLNEAMNSACACVVAKDIGAATFLVNDGENGFLYRSGNVLELYEKVARLLDDKSLREKAAAESYKTIVEHWNAENAAERFISLSERILSGDAMPDIFDDGICSRI